MNIKIVEKAGGWNLWVTEKPGDDQPPIYTASNRTRAQLVALLSAILPEMPTAPEVPREDAP